MQALQSDPSHAPSVTEPLEAEHRDLAVVLRTARQLVAGGRFEEAGPLAADVARRLEGHIDAEERVLFPVFETVTGVTMGPTTQLRCEHCVIRRILAVLGRAIAGEKRDEADALLEALLDVLASHNDTEESIVYPICRRAVRDDAVREVVAHRIAECLAPQGH